ncbi:Lon protease C-terminal proteolytic domain-containing protein [Cantharellus anzutake]|uniref:Lon protease C-terminal proteolytic domain-containing protein n=1 Tax=Cantharellus anzutake TaxID=1750568 RepID=UPI0019036526|nr:Lon protease C-terminal proteolytic domain-containing protein [Cantharellus anzutake]KAF8331857.1 Lon protease C-terminal proteolytic domain-containing protein [Cantharellus anzutake]
MTPSHFEHPRPPTLPVLFLPSPAVVLPALTVTVPITDDILRPLVKLVQQSDYPILGVFPFLGNDAPIHEWGCAARLLRLSRPSGLSLNSRSSHYSVTLQGLTRIRLAKVSPIVDESPDHLPEYSVVYPSPEDNDDLPSPELDHSFRSAANRIIERMEFETIAGNSPPLNGRGSPEVWRTLRSLISEAKPNGLVWLADMMIGVVSAEWEDKLAFLSAATVNQRIQKAVEIFNKRADISEVATKISQDVSESVSKQQKEFFLRQQLQAIQRELARLTRNNSPSSVSRKKISESDSPTTGSELDDDNDEGDDLSDMKKQIEAMNPGSEERKMAVREYKRLKRIPSGSVENGVIRNYLEWLTSLPWPGTIAQDRYWAAQSVVLDKSFLDRARRQLDEDHYGLEKIKRRLIEYLAVVRLKSLNEVRAAEIPPASNALGLNATSLTPVPTKKAPTTSKGPILLLVGPPGCGKTSVAQSVAKALDRPFQRISLGGIRDEAEIRGHRRTYVASGPGAVVQTLRRAGRPNMVLLLDEIDKVGHNNFHGDPSAALLEVLDPEQNHAFNDHYINVPVDLSQVLFIATANTLDTISGPLRDRCEVVYLSGYTYDEKIHIAKRFLVSKQAKANGLPMDQLKITDSAMQYIASRYTREAGVRNLERQIGAVVRFKAVQWADSHDTSNQSTYNPVVDVQDLGEILGLEWWDPEEREREGRKGIVNGMVVQGEGEGGILNVETILIPGSGKLRLTGSLGEVIRESGEIALSWVKSNAFLLGITSSSMEDPLLHPDHVDVHLHLPAGAQKKDGPSAGIAMVCAFVSLFTGAVVPSNVAMTGEITLRGHITAIGGVKEKLLGAHRAGISTVILPAKNRKNVEHDLGNHPLRRQMNIVFVNTVREALDAAFGPGVLSWRDSLRPGFLESRL